jgi:hypothetical protein
MVWLKACPRCRGDLFLDNDHYGKFKLCVQCGYSRDLVAGIPAGPPRRATHFEAVRLDLMSAGD